MPDLGHSRPGFGPGATPADPAVAEQPRYCRRWWALRVWPAIVCLLPICQTLIRGQVNLLVLAFLCMMIAAFLNRHSMRAGFWLSLACAVKVIPAFLIAYPLLRRDWRCLGGLCLGLIVTLVVIPMLACGPAATMNLYEDYVQTLFAPALQLSDNKVLEAELLGPGCRDNQSLKVALFNTVHPDMLSRPKTLPLWSEWTYRIGGALITIVTLVAGSRWMTSSQERRNQIHSGQAERSFGER